MSDPTNAETAATLYELAEKIVDDQTKASSALDAKAFQTFSIGTVVLNRDRLDWVVETWEDSSRWLAIDLVGPVGDATPDPPADPPEP